MSYFQPNQCLATLLSKASHSDDIFLIINKNDVQQTAELFNKQFPKITFTTAYKTGLGLPFQDVRILWSIKSPLAAPCYGKTSSSRRYTAFCLPQHIPMTVQKGCSWWGSLLKASLRWCKRGKTTCKTHLKRAEQVLLSACSSCLSLRTTLDGDGPTKHHEHRWALLLMQFSLTNAVRTENVAPGIDYVNPSDGWKLFPTKLSITDDYFCHPCSSEGKLRAEHMLRAKHRLLQEFLSQGLNLFLRMQCWFLTVEMSHEESKDRAETHLLLCWSEEEIFSPPRYFTPIVTSSYQHLPSHSCVFKSRDITIIQE